MATKNPCNWENCLGRIPLLFTTFWGEIGGLGRHKLPREWLLNKKDIVVDDPEFLREWNEGVVIF